MITHRKPTQLDLLRRESDIKLDSMHPEVQKFLKTYANDLHVYKDCVAEICIMKFKLVKPLNVTWLNSRAMDLDKPMVVPFNQIIFDSSGFNFAEQNIAKALGIELDERLTIASFNKINISADGFYTLQEIIDMNNHGSIDGISTTLRGIL